MNERIKELRIALKMNQEEFGKLLGITKSGVSDIESGRRKVTEQHIIMLQNHKINEEWLRTGEGEMFKKQPLHDEVTEYVTNLLEYDGKGNPLYDMIIEIMKTYTELDDPSKEVIHTWLKTIYKNVKAKETASCEPKQSTSISQKNDINERMEAYHDYLETQEKATGKLSS